MALSPRSRMRLGFGLANITIVVMAIGVLLQRPPQPPLIQGVLLPEARVLQHFSLLDHHNKAFTNQNLQGRWHLVSYGFTTCPDICPTTLAQLGTLAQRLTETQLPDLQIVFYSVDHRRDTTSQLASYVPYFHPDFIGLTHSDKSENTHLPFEKGLGIISQLVPLIGPQYDPKDNDYQVKHGVTLFLINPAGELQAIFEPNTGLPGMHTFDPEIILRDYLAIRGYLG